MACTQGWWIWLCLLHPFYGQGIGFDKLYLLMLLEILKKPSTCAKVGMQQACGFSQEPIYSSSSGKTCCRNETTPTAPVGFLVRLRQLLDFCITDVITVQLPLFWFRAAPTRSEMVCEALTAGCLCPHPGPRWDKAGIRAWDAWCIPTNPLPLFGGGTGSPKGSPGLW